MGASRPINRRALLKSTGAIGAAGFLSSWSGFQPARGAPSLAAQEGLGFTIIDSAEPTNLDARSYYFTPAYSVVWRINETLLHHDTMTGELHPQLATSYKIIDDRTYEFELRPDVRWHDGTPLTPDDIEFSYMQPWLDPEAVYVERVEKVSDTTVRVVTTEPFGFFLVQDVALNRRILPKHLLDGVPLDQVWEHPVGTGPFKFVEWNRGERVRLAPNEDYWGEKPSIDPLDFRGVTEAATRLVNLEAGDADLVMDPPVADLTRLADSDEVEIINSPGLGYDYLAMNLGNANLAKLEVRQAVNYAINKDALLQLYPEGFAVRTYGPLSNQSWAVNTDVPHYDHDPAKAKQLLGQAGVPDGFDVSMKTTSEYGEMAQAIQQDLAAVGINVKINVLEQATFLDQIRAGDSEMYLFGWANIVDPDHMYYVFSSEQQGKERMNFANERLDALFQQGRTTVEQEQRLPIYHEAQAIIVEEGPMVFLLTRGTLRGYREDRWTGFQPQPLPTDVLTYLNTVQPRG